MLLFFRYNKNVQGLSCTDNNVVICGFNFYLKVGMCLLFQLSEDDWEHENIVLERVSTCDLQ